MTEPHCDTCGYSSAGLTVGLRCPFMSCAGRIVVLPSVKDLMQDVKRMTPYRRAATWRDRLAEYKRVRSAGVSRWQSACWSMGLREVPITNAAAVKRA